MKTLVRYGINMVAVSNDEYNKALKNKQYLSILDRASYPFKHLLSPDVLSSCVLFGLFNFLCDYNQLLSKPSTYLSRCVHWECLRVLSSQSKSQATLYDMIEDNDTQLHVDECLSCLSDDDRQLVVDYYIGNYTYRELALKHECSHEYIRIKIQNSITKMREMVYN